MTGQPLARGEDDMRRQAETLLDAGARAVLIKGGHGEGRRKRRPARDAAVDDAPSQRPGCPHGMCMAPAARSPPPWPPAWPVVSALAEAVEDAKRYVSAVHSGFEPAIRRERQRPRASLPSLVVMQAHVTRGATYVDVG